MLNPKEPNGLERAADALFASNSLRGAKPPQEVKTNDGLRAAMDQLIAQRPAATGAGRDRAGQTQAKDGLSAAMNKVLKELPRAY